VAHLGDGTVTSAHVGGVGEGTTEFEISGGGREGRIKWTKMMALGRSASCGGRF